MNIFKFFPTAVAVLLIAASPRAFAYANSDDDDGNYVGYDDILKDLGGNGTSKTSWNDDAFADVMIHGGVGMASTFGQVRTSHETIHMNQQGVQAALGIDLFSQNWFAEATVRTFSNTSYGASTISLKEFDLKVYYKERLAPHVGFRMGAGLAARYMNVFSRGEQQMFTTPASVLAAGLDYYFSKTISVGAEMGARSALIGETGDKNSIDGTVRVDAHF
jgi:hypothetical protein